MDGAPISVIVTYDIRLVAVINTLAVIGILFSLVCLLFTIIFKDTK